MAWVAAIPAAISAASSVYQSIAGNKSAQQANQLNNQVAQQNADAQGTMLNKATEIANQPFQAYTAPLVAPISGNEQNAYGLASSTSQPNSTAASDLSSANTLVGQVGANSSWNPTTEQTYANPYTQAVTDQALNAENRNYLQSLTSSNERASQTGAFGGGQNAIMQGELAGQNQINQGETLAQGNANAYDSAMKAWQADNATKLNAASAYEKAGGDLTQMNGADISNLMKTGGVSRAIAQTGLNANYGQFMRQQDWSANQLNPLLSALGRSKGGVNQAPAIQSNTANQLLGLASTVAGLFGGGSGGGGGSAADAAGSSLGSDISGGGSALSSSYYDPSNLSYSGGAMASTGTNPFGP